MKRANRQAGSDEPCSALAEERHGQTAHDPAWVRFAPREALAKTVRDHAKRGPGDAENHRDPMRGKSFLKIVVPARVFDDCSSAQALAVRAGGAAARIGWSLLPIARAVAPLMALPAAGVLLAFARVAARAAIAGGRTPAGPKRLAEDGIDDHQDDDRRGKTVREHLCYLRSSIVGHVVSVNAAAACRLACRGLEKRPV